jgi:tetratricopeptide (TPR) repeat protein
MQSDHEMTAPARFLMLVIGIAVAAAVFLAPRRDEWLAMMSDEDKQAQIISMLEPRLARNGENDPKLLATLGRAYAETGSYQRAAQLFERYTTLRPDDIEAYARLADAYGGAGNEPQQVAMLERYIARQPALSRVAELAELYRKERLPDRELALLSRFEAELTTESGLVLRLAQLRADNGDRDSAIQMLKRSDELTTSGRSAHNDDERIFLAALLVDAGRSAEAVRLGKQWVLQWHQPWLANRLLRSVAERAPASDASELADAVVALNPEVRLFLVSELAKIGAKPVARHLLEAWANANPAPSPTELAAFLSACRHQDEPAIVWQAFGEVLRRPASIDVIARYSDAIAAEFGIGALAPFWASMPQAVTERNPLLAARLAYYERDPTTAKWLLQSVDLAKLESPDRQIWLDLLTAVASPSEAFEVLRDRRRSGRLPGDLLAQYARLAGALGQESEYRAALTDLSGKPH